MKRSREELEKWGNDCNNQATMLAQQLQDAHASRSQWIERAKFLQDEVIFLREVVRTISARKV